ncbi:MAG TPA: methyltransferase domain-containing protein [Micromonosporaceae bacterium]
MSGPFAEGGPIRPLTARIVRPADHPWPTPATGRHPSYPLDNDDPLAGTHHGCLSTLLDPFSRRRTCDLFPTGLHGRRCLEVGAGVGARYAHWLAGQVGPTGQVIAVDVKPRDVPAHPRLSVVECDLTAPDWPLTGDRFDLIHARLTLAHLPDRQDILARLVGLLAPGGWILVEDWDTTRTDMVLHAPDLQAAEEYTIVQETVGRVFTAAGTDRGWARRVHAALRTHGLTDVHTVMHAESWTGGGPGAHLAATTITELRPALLAAGLTDRQLDRAHGLLSDPDLVLAGHLLYSTAGRLTHPTPTTEKDQR